MADPIFDLLWGGRVSRLKERIERYLKRHLSRVPLRLRDYIVALIEESGNLLALYIMALSVCWAGWHLISVAWGLYNSTQVGHHFGFVFSERAMLINWLLQQDAFAIAVQVSTVCLAVSLAICALAQLSYIRHLFYSRRGYMMRIGVILAATWFVVFEQQEIIDTAGWDGFVYFLFVPPMLLLMAGSMRAAGALLPDPGDIYNGLMRLYDRVKSKLSMPG